MTNFVADTWRHILKSNPAEVFLLVDAAQHQAIWKTVNVPIQGPTWLSLLERTGNDEAVKAGPLLIHLKKSEGETLVRMVERARGKHYLSWIVSPLSHSTLRDHLSSLLDIETEDGSTWLMRYFDTRILPVWHSVLTDQQRDHVFQPVSTWGYFDRTGIPCEITGANKTTAPSPLTFTLSPAQENALLDAAYPDAIIQQLENSGNEEIGSMPHDLRYPFIAQQIKKAQTQYRIESTPDTLLFCALALAGGTDFDLEPAIAGILKKASMENRSFGDLYLQHLRTQTA